MVRILILLCLFTILTSVSTEDAVCTTTGPLGMENGFIHDTQITASDFYNIWSGPNYGRLKHNSSWATRSAFPTDPWIQVDFLDTGNEVSITGIQTQGSYYYQNWVSKLRIQTGNSKDSLTYIMVETQTKTFDANSDRDSIVTIEFPETIRARYLRILPIEWKEWVALRFEVIGCQTEIRLLQDHTSQSSTYSHWYRPGSSYKAVDRNTDGAYRNGFCSRTGNDTNAWWRVDMVESQCVGRVVIYNRIDCCGGRLTNAIIRVGEDNDTNNNPEFGRVSTADDIIQFTNGLRGRFISVHVENNILTICEIKAFHGNCSVTTNPTSKATSTTDKTSTSPYLSTSQSDDGINQPQTDLSTVSPTSKATSTNDNVTATPYLSTSQSDDGSYQPQTDLSTATPTSKAASTTDTASNTLYISTSQSDDGIDQPQTDLFTGPVVGAAVGSSVAVILIIVSVLCILKIRRNRENQPKPDTSSSKPPEVDQPYYLAVLESKPNQQSDSGVIQPVYADPNQDDPSQSTLSCDDIPKSSTDNDPDAIYYSSVGSTSGPKITNLHTLDIYAKVKNMDAPEGSLYYATSDTPEDEEGCVENAAYDSFEGNGGKENGADDAEGWEDNTLYGAASRQDEDASGWKDNDIYSGVDD